MTTFLNFTGRALSVEHHGERVNLPDLGELALSDVAGRVDASVCREGVLEILEGPIVGLPRPVPGVILIATRDVSRRAHRADVVFPLRVTDGICTQLARLAGETSSK
jgi:hypothetical protein